MIHARFASASNFDLKNNHTCYFKAEEKKFSQYKEANDWLKKNL
jgi:hypothetical protein